MISGVWCVCACRSPAALRADGSVGQPVKGGQRKAPSGSGRGFWLSVAKVGSGAGSDHRLGLFSKTVDSQPHHIPGFQVQVPAHADPLRGAGQNDIAGL